MNVVIGAKTDPGRRPNNEDQLAVVDVRRHGLRADGVLVIADGMGGRSFGEKASAAAVETVQETLIEMLAAGRADGVDTGEALASALRKANARVYALGREDEAHQGMGTTCVAAVVQGETLSIAHAGDSRAYLLRDGALERLTDDHSYVAEQVRAGVISEESAQRSRFRNVITRAVGIEPTITPDLSQHTLRPGDTVLLCTDGLTNMVPEDQIARVVQQAPSPQTAAERLIQIANRNGGKDNITAIVARLEISNRTQRMLAEELSRLNPRNRTQQMRLEDLPPPPPRNGGGSAPPSAAASAPAPAAGPRRPVQAAAPAPASRWPALLIGALCVLLGVTGYLVHVLERGGYQFQAQRPFFVLPAPPAIPPPDLSHIHYAPPALFYVRPVQGGLLTLNQADGSLTVATEASQIVRLAPDGTILFQSSPPAAAALPAVPADGNQHFAADPAGNLYVADAAARVIYRYPANGGPLGEIPSRWLQHPASLAVAADGTLYVIDAGRLLVLRPLAPGSRPVAPRGAVPVVPLPSFGDPMAGFSAHPAPPADHGTAHGGTSPAPHPHP